MSTAFEFPLPAKEQAGIITDAVARAAYRAHLRGIDFPFISSDSEYLLEIADLFGSADEILAQGSIEEGVDITGDSAVEHQKAMEKLMQDGMTYETALMTIRGRTLQRMVERLLEQEATE